LGGFKNKLKNKMPAIIYNKKTIETQYQGTGDKCFILEPKKSYQVPLPFASGWDRMRLGVIWSWTSASGSLINTDGQYNTPITDYTDGTGVVVIEQPPINNDWVLDDHSFFGLAKKTDDPSGVLNDFIGWKSNILHLSNVTDDGSGVLNKLGDSDLTSQRYPYFNCNYSGTNVNPSNLVWVSGSSQKANFPNGIFFANGSGDNFASPWVSPRVYGLKNPNPSGISPEAEENFASFWGLDITHTGSPSKEAYKISPLYFNSGNDLAVGSANLNDQYNDCRITEADKVNIKDIINGKNVYEKFWYGGNVGVPITLSDQTTNYGDINFIQDRLVDSVFFYNGFSGINIRIHSWAVLKIK
jgi:hypothetical protein